MGMGSSQSSAPAQQPMVDNVVNYRQQLLKHSSELLAELLLITFSDEYFDDHPTGITHYRSQRDEIHRLVREVNTTIVESLSMPDEEKKLTYVLSTLLPELRRNLNNLDLNDKMFKVFADYRVIRNNCNPIFTSISDCITMVIVHESQRVLKLEADIAKLEQYAAAALPPTTDK
jgi:hypothetical protein